MDPTGSSLNTIWTVIMVREAEKLTQNCQPYLPTSVYIVINPYHLGGNGYMKTETIKRIK